MISKTRDIRTTLLGLTLAGCLVGEAAQAGAFGVPTYGTPGWGRAFGGGALWHNDPAAAYNNPAAMAFIDYPVAQVSVLYADIDLSFSGQVYDYEGNPRRDVNSVNLLGQPTEYRDLNDGGNGGFARALPTTFLALPLSERWTFGLSQVVPRGMESDWDRDFVGKDFANQTKIQSVALSGSLAYKLSEQWALGGGVTLQRTDALLSQNVDLFAAAGSSPDSIPLIPFTAGVTKAQMRVDVDNYSPGWFASVAWRPTARDRLGLAYHARIRNELDGDYRWRFDDAEGNLLASDFIMDFPFLPDGRTLVELFYPGLRLNSQGAEASSRVDIPARATLDWVHQFSDRLTLGASITWTEWSSFRSLRLESGGMLIADIPYNYKDTWMYALGADYRLNNRLTLRGGVAFDQTPTRDETRDAKIPDGDRTFVSLGLSYQVAALPGLAIDAAYSRQFVDDARLRTENQDRLGGGRMDGEVSARGQVMGVSATYAF